jgi:putative nucleotidyltransferase with HDIG domain
LTQLRSQINALPVLPQAAMDALAALRDDRLDAEQCAEPIAHDPALTARLLRIANSAFYGVSGRVSCVSDAVHMLGRRTVGNAVTAATVIGQFRPVDVPGFAFAEFWRHAIGVAIAARALARQTQQDEDVAFTAGLLHDIGRLALATCFPHELAQALSYVAEADISFNEAEHERLGVDHADLGAMIATHWRLPDVVAQTIYSHHRPTAAADGGFALAHIVHLADAITHALDLSGAENEMVPELVESADIFVSMHPSKILKVFDEVETNVHRLCEALGV